MKVVKVCSCKECSEGMSACDRCGQPVCRRVISKRLTRKSETPKRCFACLAKPVVRIAYQHPVLGEIWCNPYEGNLNDDLYPVDDLGELYLPGERICGHKDCVNSNHIVPFKVVTPLVMGGLGEQLTEV